MLKYFVSRITTLARNKVPNFHSHAVRLVVRYLSDLKKPTDAYLRETIFEAKKTNDLFKALTALKQMKAPNTSIYNAVILICRNTRKPSEAWKLKEDM